MKREVANIWVTALRSGKYKQGMGYLNKNNKFCCLGVLCEIAPANELQIHKQLNLDYMTYSAGGNKINKVGRFPPVAILKWANISLDYRTYIPELDKKLWQLNDTGYTFDQIADIIEKYWEDL